MWRCTRCETDNSDSDILCNGCDWHSPNLVTLEATLIGDKDIPTYLIKWNFTHTTITSVDNGIGEVLAISETKLTIKENTKLVFLCKNEYAKKEFSKILLLPAPIIETFTASDTEIKLGIPISLSWTSKYADKVLLTDYGVVASSANKDVLLRKTSSLVLKAVNSAGKQEKAITFTLPVPIIFDFASESERVIAGDEILLTWKTSNAEKLSLIGLAKEETLISESKKLRLEKTTTLQLKAVNESGITKKELKVVVVPKPVIKFLKLNRSIALLNNEIEVSWEAENFSKLFLHINEEILEVSDKKSFKFVADKSKEIKLVCESIEKLRTISQTVLLKAIENVTVNYLTASPKFTIQSKPIILSWKVSNATEIILLPTKKKLEAEGSLLLTPSKKTVYVIEAKNELTTDYKEIEIDVLPLPSISNISLVMQPQIKLPTFYESKLRYPIIEKSRNKLIQQVKEYFINKFIIKQPKTLKTTFISFNQYSEYIEIKRDTSIMRIVSSIKSMAEYDKHIINYIKEKNK